MRANQQSHPNLTLTNEMPTVNERREEKRQQQQQKKKMKKKWKKKKTKKKRRKKGVTSTNDIFGNEGGRIRGVMKRRVCVQAIIKLRIEERDGSDLFPNLMIRSSQKGGREGRRKEDGSRVDRWREKKEST